MSKRKRIFSTFILILILCTLLPTAALANSAEPPSLTILVSDPPDDLSLTLVMSDGASVRPAVLRSERKGWGIYYRFNNYDNSFDYTDMTSAVLSVESEKYSFEVELPSEALEKYSNLVTLNLKKGTVSVGQSRFRVPLLVALRVALTLIIEGVIFLIFGYRKMRSWTVFLIVNLITQIWLNAQFTGPNLGSWKWSLRFLELAVMIVESIFFTLLIKEKNKGTTFAYVITANLVSFVAGAALIANLPV